MIVFLGYLSAVCFLVVWRIEKAEHAHTREAVNADDSAALILYTESLHCYQTKDINGNRLWVIDGKGMEMRGPSFWQTVRAHRLATDAIAEAAK